MKILLTYFIPAVLIDIIAMTTTAWTKPKCRNEVWGRANEGTLTRFDTVQFFIIHLVYSVQQCTTLVFFPN